MKRIRSAAQEEERALMIFYTIKKIKRKKQICKS